MTWYPKTHTIKGIQSIFHCSRQSVYRLNPTTALPILLSNYSAPPWYYASDMPYKDGPAWVIECFHRHLTPSDPVPSNMVGAEKYPSRAATRRPLWADPPLPYFDSTLHQHHGLALAESILLTPGVTLTRLRTLEPELFLPSGCYSVAKLQAIGTRTNWWNSVFVSPLHYTLPRPTAQALVEERTRTPCSHLGAEWRAMLANILIARDPLRGPRLLTLLMRLVSPLAKPEVTTATFLAYLRRIEPVSVARNPRRTQMLLEAVFAPIRGTTYCLSLLSSNDEQRIDTLLQRIKL